MSRTECTIHDLVLDTTCSGILDGILSEAVTRPEIMVDRKWLYTTAFRAPRYMVNVLLQYSMTRSVDYSMPLMPLEGTSNDYRIPVDGSTLMEVTDISGKVVRDVIHSLERHGTPIRCERVRSMCLCVYCTTYHPYTVLEFSTTCTLPHIMVKYREYEGKERPLHSRAFY